MVEQSGAGKGSFLGTGWAFPPSFIAGGAEVEMVSDAEDVHQSLQLLLSTRLGERPLRPEFGCDLSEVMFEEIDQQLVNRVTALINDAVLYHETRVVLNAVDVSRDRDEPGLLLITLDYELRAVNSRFNLVYPFYLDEATGAR